MLRNNGVVGIVFMFWGVVYAASASAGLEQGVWRMLTFLNASGEQQEAGDIVVKIRFDNGSITGKAGCNTFFGTYQEKQPDELRFPNLGATRKACIKPIMQKEHVFLNHMHQVRYYRLEDNMLSLLDQNKQALMVLETPEPVELEGTQWRVTGIRNDQAGVVNDALNQRITALFNDGSLNGSAGCNQYSASYERKDSTLTVGPTMTTRKACEAAGVMEREQQYLSALKQSKAYRLEGDRLEIRDAKGALLLQFKAVPVAE